MDKLRNLGKRFIYGNPNRPDLRAEDLPTTEPQRFFAILKVNWTKVFTINILYVLFMLPVLAWIFLNLAAGVFTDVEAFNELSVTFMIIMVPLMILEAPVLAGISYLCNRWARDEHTFIWMDFKDAVKENWKQAMLLQTFSMVLYALSFISMRIYGALSETHWFMTIGTGVLLLVVVILGMMNNFMIPMAVRYRMNVRTIIRNSFLLSMARLPTCVLATLGFAVPIILCFFIPQALQFVGLYYLVFGFGFKHFTRGYYAQKAFDKYMKPEGEALEVEALEEDA